MEEINEFMMWPISPECYRTFASSTDPMNKESWSLAHHVKNFLETNAAARSAFSNAEAAEQNYINIAKNLYKYLKVADFDPIFRIASRPTFKLVGIPKLLKDKISENPHIINDMRQPLVQVNQIIFDLSFRRLGTEYLGKPDGTDRELKKLFKVITENSKLIELTAEDAKQLQENQHAAMQKPIEVEN